MTPLTTVRVAVFMIALVLIGYGMRTDNSTLRLIGIALLGLVLMLRFVRKEKPE
jgi:hypothetical protein